MTTGYQRDLPTTPTNEQIQRLQRAILRLALEYRGRHSALDEKLQLLTDVARSNDPQTDRQPLIDDIVETINALDLSLAGAAETHAQSGIYSLLLEFLQRLQGPKDLHAEITRACDGLSLAGNEFERSEHLRRLANSLSANLVSVPGQTIPVTAVQSMLHEMVTALPKTRDNASALAALREQVIGAEDPTALAAASEAITASYVDLHAAAQTETLELSGFLADTVRRLQEFDQLAERLLRLQRDSDDDIRDLNNTMGGDLTSLRTDASAAVNLDAIQTLIASHLERLDTCLNAFVRAQSSRSAARDQAMEQMRRRLQELETQTEDLRGSLETQHSLATVDPLTGIANRYGYMQKSASEVERWSRQGGQLSLVVIDVDFFKDINDSFGHNAGDRVLATIAQELNRTLRRSDSLARYGGEEFVLLLPDASEKDAEDLAEKLRQQIERCPFHHKDTPVSVTISCGVASFRRGDTLEQVFERADQAMYVAKHLGRNRVCTEAHLESHP
jgi:diguanylate cyclase (GGDEF)-like protein